MLHLRERTVMIVPDPTGRRIRIGILGVLLFKPLQFGHQPVEFSVVYCRCIENIIIVIMLVQLSP